MSDMSAPTSPLGRGYCTLGSLSPPDLHPRTCALSPPDLHSPAALHSPPAPWPSQAAKGNIVDAICVNNQVGEKVVKYLPPGNSPLSFLNTTLFRPKFSLPVKRYLDTSLSPDSAKRPRRELEEAEESLDSTQDNCTLSATDPAGTLQCQVCLGPDGPATATCLTCPARLCTRCLDSHRRVRCTRWHHVHLRPPAALSSAAPLRQLVARLGSLLRTGPGGEGEVEVVAWGQLVAGATGDLLTAWGDREDGEGAEAGEAVTTILMELFKAADDNSTRDGAVCEQAVQILHILLARRLVAQPSQLVEEPLLACLRSLVSRGSEEAARAGLACTEAWAGALAGLGARFSSLLLHSALRPALLACSTAGPLAAPAAKVLGRLEAAIATV